MFEYKQQYVYKRKQSLPYQIYILKKEEEEERSWKRVHERKKNIDIHPPLTSLVFVFEKADFYGCGSICAAWILKGKTSAGARVM